MPALEQRPIWAVYSFELVRSQGTPATEDHNPGNRPVQQSMSTLAHLVDLELQSLMAGKGAMGMFLLLTVRADQDKSSFHLHKSLVRRLAMRA